ncbi:39S ribosomal protein L35, mitochondrial-like [Stegodyphus dumicola]|uniref:39S ribosomal protein L35, mitochondrial-like n=1 Tax=Stegodyphus dumicola TaxID=202533 RepID=UPI0015B0E4B7|nr:39S ribosomal protein L35, mitochondrial-like [Stegodyphus dumicola]
MLKSLVAAGSQVFRSFTGLKVMNSPSCSAHFSSWMNSNQKPLIAGVFSGNNLLNERAPNRSLLFSENPNINVSRSVTKFSLKTGKMKSVGAVLSRFYRLDNGLWIRRRAGSHKHLWRRNYKSRYEKVQHVVCTKTQCIMFDKMVSKAYKKKKYFIDDPFEPYEKRNNFDYVLPIRHI